MAQYEYYCPNKFADPCEFAQAERRFAEGEVPSSMDGGAPRCPGKCASGKDCGETLIRIPKKGGVSLPLPLPILGAAAGGLALVLAALFLWPPPGASDGRLKVETDPVIFVRNASGLAIGELRVRNDGEGPLTIERVDASPSTFSSDAESVTLQADDAKTLFLQFRGDEGAPIEGTAEVHSDAATSPVSVRLVANRSPWWVYEQLEKESRILKPAPQ